MNCGGLERYSWPPERLGEALEALGRRTGFAPPVPGGAQVPSWDPGARGPAEPALAGAWIEHAAARLGLEAEPLDAPPADAERMLRGAAPAVVGLPGKAPRSFLVLLKAGKRGAVALCPDLEAREVDPGEVLAALRSSDAGAAASDAERVLDRLGLRGARRDAARRSLERGLSAGQRIGGVWWIRPAGTSRLPSLMREAGLPRLFLSLAAAQAVQFALWIASWWILGRAALDGRLDRGWLAGWGLLLLTLIPLHLLVTYAGGLLSIRAGVLFKRRLLFGAVKLDTEELRHLGAGQLLGRVIESDVIEQMAIAGGFLAVTGLIEVLLSSFVLASGAGGWLHFSLLLGWLGVTLLLAADYRRRRGAWTGRRLSMTNDLVERMVGHRTRLAQEDYDRSTGGEDQALEGYLAGSRSLDAACARLVALAPRGWLIAGILGVAPAFVSGQRSTASLAVAIGGVLLAYQAFRHLAVGLERCASVAIAWREVRPFWRAASRKEPLGEVAIAGAGGAAENGTALLDVRDVSFRYPGRADCVLKGLHVRIGAGDRILLEGPSGGGKSTLGSLLSGARAPESGLVLFRGLDQETLGKDAWRQRAVLVPQFHENHVFLGTFAFNALMGRTWPPRVEDMKEAEAVCRSLGLGPLLDRMPAGMLQLVGETGWQLSHGERSRLYIARALLQHSELMILDESFAALDPGTLRSTLEYVLKRARTVVVIAHP